MGSSADEVDVSETLHAVMGSEVEHLVERMGEVEGRPHEDIVLFPAGRGEAAFLDDMRTKVFHSGLSDDSVKDSVAISFLIIFPRNALMTIVNRRAEDVELGMTFGGH